MKLQSAYLTMMGITVWQLRKKTTGMSIKAPIYEGETQIGLVILDQKLTPETHLLLNKIFAILGYRAGEFHAEMTAPKEMKVIISFGANSYDLVDCTRIDLPGLQDMLQDPSLKRVAWDKLKKYLNIMKN